jgi:hypothetical protein
LQDSAALTLFDPYRFQLRGPFERQIDPVKQGLNVEVGRLASLADRLDDGGCSERQA